MVQRRDGPSWLHATTTARRVENREFLITHQQFFCHIEEDCVWILQQYFDVKKTYEKTDYSC